MSTENELFDDYGCDDVVECEEKNDYLSSMLGEGDMLASESDFLPSREDKINKCAYHLWEERVKNNIPGTEHDDWLAAESLLKEKGVI